MAQATHLTVDQGNSTVGVVAWSIEGGRAQVFGRYMGLDAIPAELQELAGPVLLSSVADHARRSTLAEALELRFDAVVVPDHGLALAIRHPETCGLDRLFAARAAAWLFPAGAVVVDCGTAMTVDAVRVGTFEGGAIAPGPALLVRALAEGGAQLHAVEPRPGVPAIGRETRAALEAGVVVGLRGAARELVLRQLAELGLPDLPVVVTGGARSLLLEPTTCLPGEVHERPDLVHEGLLLAGLPGVLLPELP
ncbi:MAG: type III pantothenate kinase [Planctomycetota bacterium]|nr:type III pantothenate kinase [Planctomycetota bacterium]